MGETGFLAVVKTLFASVLHTFRWLSFCFAVLALLTSLLMTIAPRIMQQLIDHLTNGRGFEPFFWKMLVLYGICLLGGAVCRVTAGKLSFYIATQIEDKWRYKGLRHYYNLHLAWHDQHDSGEIGSKIDKGGSAVFVIIHELMGHNLLLSFLTLFFVIAYTFWLFPVFGFILLLPIPFYLFVTGYISKKIERGQAHLNILSNLASRALYDGVANARAVKAFGKEKEETAYYANKWDAYHNYEYGVERLWFLQSFFQHSIEISGGLFLFAYCAYAIIKGNITIGQVILLISYQQMTFAPLAQLNQFFTRLRRNVKRTAHLFEIIDTEDILQDNPKAVSITTLKNEIQLRNVHFEYSGKIAALHDVTLRIPAGTTTALVGRSGAGKTTLALLLMRFYDPEEGIITFDGVDLKKIKKASLRRQVAWIPQETTLLNRTIRENISYGKNKVSQQEIERAAQLAHAHDFIMSTPQGYNSIIGERGVKLSGGQRQRLAIARALLTKPSVIIMDESTSHLDSETEKAISESICGLHHTTTQVIIAHRLSTILHADQIIVLDKGQIVATGKHKELLANPIYKKLYTLQFHRRE